MTLTDGGDSGIARRGVQLCQERRLGELPGERVLTATGADEEDPQSSAQGEDRLAALPRADERDRDAERVLDEANVRGGGVRKLASVELLLPARKRLPDGPAVVEVRLVGGEVVRLAAVRKHVAHADRNLGEVREDVELRQRERGDAVDPHREAQRR